VKRVVVRQAFSRVKLSTDNVISDGMRRRTKAVIGGVSVVAFLLFFFLAPVMFWFNIGPAHATSHPNFILVYRSASCVVFGYGDVYSQFLAANSIRSGLHSDVRYQFRYQFRSLGCTVLDVGNTILVGGYDVPQFQPNFYAPPIPQ
jgi:hypothetical protein